MNLICLYLSKMVGFRTSCCLCWYLAKESVENDDTVSSLSLISSVETLTNKDEVDEEAEGTGDGGGESSLNEVKVLDIF